MNLTTHDGVRWTAYIDGYSPRRPRRLLAQTVLPGRRLGRLTISRRAAPARSVRHVTAPVGTGAAATVGRAPVAEALADGDRGWPGAVRSPRPRPRGHGVPHRGGAPAGPVGSLVGRRGLRGVAALLAGVLLWSSVSACAVPKAAGAPLAPIERAWELPTLELYNEWWRKTEACSGRTGDMSQVTFYAVDAPSGAIGLHGAVAHGWWVRQGNRIYLPANGLSEEWLVRHEMLHALLRRGSHPNKEFVAACHLASIDAWRDSTLRVDPDNPQGH